MPDRGSMSPNLADPLRDAEAALARLGYARIPPPVRGTGETPEFWVREAGVPRRAFPVFVEAGAPSKAPSRPLRWVNDAASRGTAPPRAIVIVGTDMAARALWERRPEDAPSPIDSELAILVVPTGAGAGPAHWHRGLLAPRTLLRLATGVAVGLFRQAQESEGSTQVDFSEMLEILKTRFQVDVAGSLGVRSDEEALFMLYQLAQRHAYAPGDAASELYTIVLRPFGPGPRVPWFAA